MAGDLLVWRDPMHHGPFPADTTLEAASPIRARYLAAEMLDAEAVEAQFVQRDTTLSHLHQYKEVILWFEHDLLDQLQLMQILSAIDDPSNLSLICIDEFAGVSAFRGLGQLSAAQLTTLYPARVAVTMAQLQQAGVVWKYFCSDDPTALVAFAKRTDCLFPFLRQALFRHFQEYPWIEDGLTRTERQLMTLLQEARSTPARLFGDNMHHEHSLFIGDWCTFRILDQLARCPTPLITATQQPYLAWADNYQSADTYRRQSLDLTATGRAVLDLSQHATAILGRDCWLGGVRIRFDAPHWQWDNRSKLLTKAGAH